MSSEPVEAHSLISAVGINGTTKEQEATTTATADPDTFIPHEKRRQQQRQQEQQEQDSFWQKHDLIISTYCQIVTIAYWWWSCLYQRGYQNFVCSAHSWSMGQLPMKHEYCRHVAYQIFTFLPAGSTIGIGAQLYPIYQSRVIFSTWVIILLIWGIPCRRPKRQLEQEKQTASSSSSIKPATTKIKGTATVSTANTDHHQPEKPQTFHSRLALVGGWTLVLALFESLLILGHHQYEHSQHQPSKNKVVHEILNRGLPQAMLNRQWLWSMTWCLLLSSCGGWYTLYMLSGTLYQDIMILWSTVLLYGAGIMMHERWTRLPKLDHTFQLWHTCQGHILHLIRRANQQQGASSQHGIMQNFGWTWTWPANREWPIADTCPAEKWLIKWVEGELNSLPYIENDYLLTIMMTGTGIFVVASCVIVPYYCRDTRKQKNKKEQSETQGPREDKRAHTSSVGRNDEEGVERGRGKEKIE